MQFDSSSQEFDLGIEFGGLISRSVEFSFGRCLTEAWKHAGRSAGAPPSVRPRGLLLERMIGPKMTNSVTREVGIEGEKSESIIRIDSDRSGFREAQYGGR
jgi:hypothetical protein